MRALLSIACMCVVAAVAAPSPPAWPTMWIARLTQVATLAQPPFDEYWPAPPFVATPQRTFYDWRRKAMREVYDDACVPIFPTGSSWSCDFLNVNDTSYLLRHADRPVDQPECCVFERPWEPPAPTFLAGAPFLRTTQLKGRTVNWYQLDVPVDEGGPFGYGFFADSGLPAGFYFGAFWHWANGTNAPGATLQYYDHFAPDQAPPESTWVVPASCQTASRCSDWNSARRRRRLL